MDAGSTARRFGSAYERRVTDPNLVDQRVGAPVQVCILMRRHSGAKMRQRDENVGRATSSNRGEPRALYESLHYPPQPIIDTASGFPKCLRRHQFSFDKRLVHFSESPSAMLVVKKGAWRMLCLFL